MDPVSALALAGNIVQFVDFSFKLLRETKTIYQSSSGGSEDNDVIEKITMDVISLNNNLTASAAPAVIPEDLRALAGQCKLVAEKLLKALEDVKVKGSHRVWKSFKQALENVWKMKKEEINSLVIQTERLRNEMQYRLQWMLR
ncbi:MAG: hypothetical protein Q9167_001765 [Letrouitia subvulpina]